jgi:hypothetical protein
MKLLRGRDFGGFAASFDNTMRLREAHDVT